MEATPALTADQQATIAQLTLLYEKFQNRDLTLMDMLNDVFEYDSTAHPLLPLSDISQTKLGFINWVKAYNEQFEHIDLTPTQFDVVGEETIVTLSMTQRNKATDKVHTITAKHHWTFKDGKGASLKVTGA